MKYATLKGAQDDKIIKGFAVASNSIIPEYYFRTPYALVQNIRGNNTSNDHDILDGERHILTAVNRLI
jgi:hypothetical protein